MTKLNWGDLLLMFFAIGCFLSVANASETKGEQAKAAPAKAAPAKAASGRVGMHAKLGEQHKEGHRVETHHFHGTDYHHWDAHDRELWRGGAWRHERYMGRLGYWWVVGGMWYFYDVKPVGLYPVLVPAISFEAPAVGEPIYVQQPTVRHQILIVQPQVQYSYWCDNPKGYSPYVSSCPSGWHKVPMTATQPPLPQYAAEE